MSGQPKYDAAVVGAGPAGLAATAALASEGLEVACINPVHPPRWPNTYGVWVDELRAAELDGCIQREWKTPRVELPGGRSHELDRRYALVDNAAMRSRLIRRAGERKVDWIEAAAVGSEPTRMGVAVQTRSGEAIFARLAVDATGHDPVLASRRGPGRTGHQTAYGIVAECDPPPCGRDEMLLMDFRTENSPGAAPPDETPTFLYAMKLGGDRYLLEETSLVSEPPVSFDHLKGRLWSRLERRGLDLEVARSEHVRIPMGLPIPTAPEGVLPFGGAASMVHPATGYMVGRSVQQAVPMAAEVSSALHEGGSSQLAVRRGWRSIWPRSLRRARDLLIFGQQALLQMDVRQTVEFFDAFFSLPTESWSDYMSGRVSAARTAKIMWKVFGAVDFRIRGQLVQTALSGSGMHLLRSLTR